LIIESYKTLTFRAQPSEVAKIGLLAAPVADALKKKTPSVVVNEAAEMLVKMA
jgi:hypothetical protein